MNISSTPTSHLTTPVVLVNTNLILYKTLSKHVLKWCFDYMFSNILTTLLLTILIGLLLANIDKLLSKSLSLVSFFQHNLFVLYYTNSMFLQHVNLQRENDTQQKDKEKKCMLPHFLPKLDLKKNKYLKVIPHVQTWTNLNYLLVQSYSTYLFLNITPYTLDSILKTLTMWKRSNYYKKFEHLFLPRNLCDIV